MIDYDILYSQTCLEFVAVAGEYCGFVENSEKFEQKEFLEKNIKLLPLLYFKAGVIPSLERENEGEIQYFVNEMDYNFYYTAISEKLDTNDVFVDVFQPQRQESSESVNLSMSECFSDIYQDLKNFISNFQTGVDETMYESLCECKYNFETLWGPRLIALLNEIHCIVFS